MSASESLLQELHEELTKLLLKKIKEGCAKPQDLAVAAKFLKDNNIDVLARPGQPIVDLARELGEQLFAGPDADLQ